IRSVADGKRPLPAPGMSYVAPMLRLPRAGLNSRVSVATGLLAALAAAAYAPPAHARHATSAKSPHARQPPRSNTAPTPEQKVAVTTFRETKLHLRAEVEDNLWTKVGPAIARACADASKPRKRDRNPLMIEAGTPLADR